ncbi:MAG TPA: hypothetical protein VKE94_11500 [Gemmataceae bacterium]|nr:hypothetical protein [Gemmataceae bacterium]
MTTNSMREYTRDELLALTPARYLSNGFVDSGGKPRPELQTTYATAAGTQLLAAELSPQELAFTYEALRQSLPLHEGAPPQRIRATVDEALETVRGLIGQPNNPGLTKWINECAASVKGTSDIDAFMDHVLAVLRQYTVMVAFRKP